jgi:hypothetical protein
MEQIVCLFVYKQNRLLDYKLISAREKHFLYSCVNAVSLTNSNGETPREVAIRFASAGCIALLAPKVGEAWQGEEAELDRPSSVSVERAKEQVEQLIESLQRSKDRFRELGGELPEDREIELLKSEHTRYCSKRE